MRAVGTLGATILLVLLSTSSPAMGTVLIPDGYGPPTAHPDYNSTEGAPSWAHNWGSGGLVLQGFDVVEYRYLQPNDTGVQGDPRFSFVIPSAGYNYTFWFKNETNLKTFADDPWSWAPKYGGFCAWGAATEWVSTGYPWTEQTWGPPAGALDGWLVHDGDLYISIRRDVSQMFLEQINELKKVADARWLNYWGEVHSGPFNTHCYPSMDSTAKCSVL
mmetsp:Transcript_13912/g.39371  ORF Transcript_13912/g.39371 Transcript_13912/m.39371 type:complete len:218 (+) Transcript_13912:217-870(+)|eukprot:CAMPEP_0117668932 /NCGR_PEP_ID=MMETSP0804-20121206/11837_1 /TAXON_ID=1074897 /ORGANISM="Tetraselmis astigmatica, Strain CCMP880" /LENGTH=217 /DNA_ID=CAMNT_0005476905 /DNA_START=194 /DNA_END=847 /DNA_ORIENTATION=+